MFGHRCPRDRWIPDARDQCMHRSAAPVVRALRNEPACRRSNGPVAFTRTLAQRGRRECHGGDNDGSYTSTCWRHLTSGDDTAGWTQSDRGAQRLILEESRVCVERSLAGRSKPLCLGVSALRPSLRAPRATSRGVAGLSERRPKQARYGGRGGTHPAIRYCQPLAAVRLA